MELHINESWSTSDRDGKMSREKGRALRYIGPVPVPVQRASCTKRGLIFCTTAASHEHTYAAKQSTSLE